MTTVAQLKQEIDALRQERDLHYQAGYKVQTEMRTLYQRWYHAEPFRYSFSALIGF